MKSDSFKNRWIDKNSKKKNLPKLMDEIYYEENGSTKRECWPQAAFGFNNLGIHFDSKHIFKYISEIMLIVFIFRCNNILMTFCCWWICELKRPYYLTNLIHRSRRQKLTHLVTFGFVFPSNISLVKSEISNPKWFILWCEKCDILNRLAQKIFWAIFQSFPGRLNAFIEILFCFSHKPKPRPRHP